MGLKFPAGIILGIFILVGGLHPTLALQVQASISGNETGIGEPIQLTVQVIGEADDAKLPWPEVQGLESFKVEKNVGKSSGSQTTIVNGKINQNKYIVTQFTYTLTPTTAGTFNIGPIHYKYGDFDKDLGSASLVVTKSEPGLASRPTLSKGSAYLGEQVFYNLRIIPGPGVQSISLPQDVQKAIGERFYFQRLDKAIEATTVTLDGKPTRVFDIRIALFPLVPGKAKLEGIPIEYQQMQKGRGRRGGSMFDLFDDEFFGGNGRLKTLSAEAAPLSMQVLPLPEGAPNGFDGAVGQYELEATLDKLEIASGDAVGLTIVIRGDGQPKSITRPVLPSLQGMEIYDPEENTLTVPKGTSLQTTKTFKYVLVAHNQGELKIGSIRFPFFNPKLGQYAEAASAPLVLNVTPGTGIARSPSMMPMGQGVSDLGTDIRHIKSGGKPLHRGNAHLYRSIPFLALFALCPVLLAGALVVRTRQRKLQGDIGYRRRSQADAVLKKRLREAQAALQTGGKKDFHRLLALSLLGFASDHCNTEFQGMTEEDTTAKLKSFGVSEKTLETWRAMHQRCDFGRFAGGGMSDEELKKDLEAAEKLLAALDKELP